MNLGAISTPLNPGSFFKPFIPLEKGAVEGFAIEMARRASQAELPGGVTRTVDDEGLKKAVEGAVGYVEENFGDRAARTFMGIVLKDASGRGMDEGEMGDAFVNGLEFLDRTFGVEAGDKAMEFFNGELNQALNGYYQNGSNESFLAMDLGEAKDKLGQAAGQAAAAVMKKFAQNAIDPGALLMDQAASDLDESLGGTGEVGNGEVGAGEAGQTVADEAAPRLDENGRPVEGGQAAAAGAGAAADAKPETAAVAGEEKPGRRVAGAKRRGRGRGGRRVKRRRVDSGNPYDKSNLRPGQVLDKKI